MPAAKVCIRRIEKTDAADWLRMRCQMWPDIDEVRHSAAIAKYLADRERYEQYIARTDSGEAIGFAEASFRVDYVNGSSTSPLAYLEMIYVAPQARRNGTALAMVDKVRAWAASRGLTELASDSYLDNPEAHKFHRAAGFTEAERVVCFISKVSEGAIGRSDS